MGLSGWGVWGTRVPLLQRVLRVDRVELGPVVGDLLAGVAGDEWDVLVSLGCRHPNQQEDRMDITIRLFLRVIL